MDTVDINTLVLSPGLFTLPVTPQTPPKPKKGLLFLSGPVPWDWLEQAARLPGKAMAVSVILWHLAGLCKVKTIRWQPTKAKRMGVSRHAAYRAIKSLETAGLVTVKRKPGQCPVITILDIAGKATDEENPCHV